MTAVLDHYPSRTRPDPELIPRYEPVVWDRNHPGPLDATDLERFDRDGFLIIDNVLAADEVSASLDEIARLAADPEVLASDESIVEPDNYELRSLFRVHQSNTYFARIAGDPRLADVARQILADDVYIHQSRVNLKPGLRGREFYWHSDFETWHVEDGMPMMRAVSCAVALTPNSTWNGPLLVIPGSHRYFVACIGETPERHYEKSLRRQEYGVPDDESLRRLFEAGGITEFLGGPGSVVFFDCNMMHGSGGNISPQPRSNLFFVYNAVSNALTEPFGTPEPRPDYIASRTFDAV